MLLSMTGFATKTFALQNKDKSHAQITMSLKTLNSRFFEVTCKMPYALHHLEHQFIKLFKTHLHRGNITFIIHMSNPNLFKGSIESSITLVDGYLKAINKIQQECNVPGTITIADLMQLPNIFTVEESVIDHETEVTLFTHIEKLLQELMQVRAAEGASLENDINQRCTILASEITVIESAAHVLMQQRKQDVNAKLAQFAQDGCEVTDAQRMQYYNELNKIDIHEEIVRFKMHLNSLQHYIKTQDVEKGRRIDFILQELAREINTIAAKCSAAEISSHAINIKVELEKIREQIQNIV